MTFNRSILLLSLVAPICLSATLAQTGRGTVTGNITDVNGGSLQGVRVTLTPGNASALTDSTGQFTILGVAAGQYTLNTDYSGFAVYTHALTVNANQAVRADAKLPIASTNSDVQVYAGRQGGEIEAINRTFNSDNIINVLPADVIVSLPNANVADAIGRLPGVSVERDEGESKYVQIRGTEPRLTHTTVDGVTIASPESVRQIKLDIIPADLVESVQINKTLQANQEGDGIGGSVDLRTKSAGDRPTYNLEALGGYNPIINGRSNYQFDGTVGQRFGATKKFGAIVAASYDWNGRGINDVEPGPALTGTYDLRDYQYYRGRYGFGGTLDYRLSDTSNLYFKYLYAHFNNYGTDWIYSPTINSFADKTTLTQGGTDGTVNYSVLNRRPIQDIGSLQFGGNHVLKQALLHYDLNTSVGRTRDAGYATAQFRPFSGGNPLNNIQYNLNLTNPLIPHLDVQNGVNIFDTTHLYFRQNQIQNFYSPEVDLGFGASLAIPYHLGGKNNTFEFGGRFRNEHKFVNQDTRIYRPNLGTGSEDSRLQLAAFLQGFTDPNYYGKSYQFGRVSSYDAVAAFTPVVDSGSGDTLGNQFNQIEKVPAGYIMNTSELNRFRLILGLRIENTSENLTGFIGTTRTTTAVGGTPVKATNSYINLLPSASLRYALTPSQGIRLVYGRGLSRPDFGSLVPFATITSNGNTRPSVSQGNPYLQTEYADDIDLLYENLLSHQGLLQAGFFYKNLSNPLVSVQRTLPASDPNFPGYISTTTANAGSAYIYGFEISFQQHFTYLPGLASGLGVSANYGHTTSQAKLPPFLDPATYPDKVLPVGVVSGPQRGIYQNAPLLRQAPNTFNISPTYDKKNLSVRLGITYNQANINAYNYNTGADGPITQGGNGGGINGPNGDNYFYSHIQIDLEGTYKLPKGFTAVASGLNLNNEVFGFYQGNPNFPVQREFYRQNFTGGLRWSPPRLR